MSETLTFDKTHYYNTLKPGISLTAILHPGQESVECEARLDTGSSHCIFKRAHGELLGLISKAVLRKTSGPLPVRSRRIHEETIKLNIEPSKTPVKPPWLQPFELNLLALSRWSVRN